MRVVITGKEGQLGLELQHQLEQVENVVIYSFNSRELDITDQQRVDKQLKDIRPHIVINCAAYTVVDLCEQHQDKAHQVNVLGPKYLAQACDQIGAKLVHVSTDYVFNGYFNNIEAMEDEEYLSSSLEYRMHQAKRSIPWVETDEVEPQNVYGKTKVEGEEMVREYCSNHFIVRTAWLYGEGNNFVRTMLKLAKTNKELNVVADQFGNPTSTKELAHVIIDLVQTEYYGTYHATCEGVCSWYDLACKIFKIKGLEVQVNPVTSEAFPRPAKRPYYSALENKNLKELGLNTFKHWEEALKEYLGN